MPPWEQYAKKPWERDRGSPALANEVMNNGLMSNATPEQASAVNEILSPEDMEMETYIAYTNAKTGTNFTHEMAQANIEYEYGEGATAQTANAENRKAAKWQKMALGAIKPFVPVSSVIDSERHERVKNVFSAWWEGLKGGGKMLPEYMTASMVQSGLSPKIVGGTSVQPSVEQWRKYQEDLAIASEQIDSMEAFKDLRASAEPHFEKRDVASAKVRSEGTQSLVKSFKERNWEQMGRDTMDAISLELPNFATMIGFGMIDPSLGLAYAGTQSGSDRYAEGIREGETPMEASSAATGHAMAEVVFERMGTIGQLDEFMKRQAKKEFKRGFTAVAKDVAREPATEMATTGETDIVFPDDRHVLGYRYLER